MPIKFKQLSYVYFLDTPYQFQALKDIDLELEMGKITAIIGKTGSGKSTLVQHLNGLLLPTKGKLEILDREIIANVKTKKLKMLRKDVGLVFQFPEYQLFEETILKDVSFGPKNFNVSEEEAIEKAKHALELVGIEESYYQKSPLELSGGQKRRIAIAGILAMNPKVLVLDEPTAGLDPQGAKQMMELFKELNTKHEKTILIVTHNMEHVLDYCDNVVVIKDGEIQENCKSNVFFENTSMLDELGILAPQVIRLRDKLIQKGFNIDKKINNVDDLSNAIFKAVNVYE
jgi:energy-coupling factor transport system ATP-binding protein